MKLLSRLAPRSMVGQMMLVLALSFVLLLAALTAAEQSDQGDVSGWAQSEFTLNRLRNVLPLLRFVRDEDLPAFVTSISKCHDGYEISDRPFATAHSTAQTDAIAAVIAGELKIAPEYVRVGETTLTKKSFGYERCPPGEMIFPLDGLVVSVKEGEYWLHAEIHPHEWHLRSSFVSWFRRSAGVFLVVAAIGVAFMFRLSRPLRQLTGAAQRFGDGLKFHPVEETGPPDIRRTIGAFNAMQARVAQEVGRRMSTLAALSHDLKTPLTGLRVKTEMLEDPAMRADFIASVRKMEGLINAALEFLRGEARDEPKRLVDLTALVESECAELEELGEHVRLSAKESVQCYCRPDAIARAVRNLIDNALKYGGTAHVDVRSENGWTEIAVADFGPGIPAEIAEDVTEPFIRVSPARGSDKGGFGLGLAVVKAVAESHGGALLLSENTPHGLIATLRIRRTPSSAQ